MQFVLHINFQKSVKKELFFSRYNHISKSKHFGVIISVFFPYPFCSVLFCYFIFVLFCHLVLFHVVSVTCCRMLNKTNCKKNVIVVTLWYRKQQVYILLYSSLFYHSRYSSICFAVFSMFFKHTKCVPVNQRKKWRERGKKCAIKLSYTFNVLSFLCVFCSFLPSSWNNERWMLNCCLKTMTEKHFFANI